MIFCKNTIYKVYFNVLLNFLIKCFKITYHDIIFGDKEKMKERIEEKI